MLSPGRRHPQNTIKVTQARMGARRLRMVPKDRDDCHRPHPVRPSATPGPTAGPTPCISQPVCTTVPTYNRRTDLQPRHQDLSSCLGSRASKALKCNQSTGVRTAPVKVLTNTNRSMDGMPNQMPFSRIFSVLAWPCFPSTTNRRCPSASYAAVGLQNISCSSKMQYHFSAKLKHCTPQSNAAGPKLKAQSPSVPCGGNEGLRPRRRMECRTPRRLACTRSTLAESIKEVPQTGTYQGAPCPYANAMYINLRSCMYSLNLPHRSCACVPASGSFRRTGCRFSAPV